MSTSSQFAAVILAAGKGTRMMSDLPKVMHAVAGKPMLSHVITSAEKAGADRVIVVTAPDMDNVRQTASSVFPQSRFAQQAEQLGTGHAVRCAEAEFKDYTGPVLVLYGDSPLITAATLEKMLEAVNRTQAAVAVLGMRTNTPNEYGRLIQATDGSLERIVEWKDANEQERAAPLCNSGVMAIKGNLLPSLLAQLDNKNAKTEYYLTDIVAHAHAANHTCAVVEANELELMGVNSRAELAVAENIMQQRLRNRAMKNGATLIAPETVFFSSDTELGRDTIIHPFVIFGAKVRVGSNVEIRSYSHLENATIDRGAVIGPFARLRPGAHISEQAHIGNFVEIKNATIGKGAKANHLSYIGDAIVGDSANIGAGTITCNYDGFDKYKTTIEAGAFIGSNTALVAPVTVGSGAIIGAGSVITTDVEQDALSFTRTEQTQKSGWAVTFRTRKKLKK